MLLVTGSSQAVASNILNRTVIFPFYDVQHMLLARECLLVLDQNRKKNTLLLKDRKLVFERHLSTKLVTRYMVTSPSAINMPPVTGSGMKCGISGRKKVVGIVLRATLLKRTWYRKRGSGIANI